MKKLLKAMGIAAGMIFVVLLFISILIMVESRIIHCDDSMRLFLVGGIIFLVFIIITIFEYIDINKK